MPKFVTCPCTGATLDRLVQPAILAALTEGDMHGYLLAERISRMPGLSDEKPDVSGIYRFLKKMEAAGLVASSWDAGDKGHAKRLFGITSNGRACLTQWTATLDKYLKTIAALLNETKAAVRRKPPRRKPSAK